MDKRILWGCIAALGLLVLFALITLLLDARLNQAVMTPLGELPLLDLAGVLVAMAAGGAVAGTRFAWFAVALMALVWALSIIVLATAPTMSLQGVLKYNALAMLTALGLAWLGAMLGARYGQRWLARRATAL